MKQPLVKNRLDMLVCKGVIDHPSVLAVLDQLCLLEDAQLVRNGGFGHAQKDGDIANAHFRAEQGAKDLDPRGIAEHLKDIRQIKERIIIGHMLPHIVYDLFMNGIAIAPVNIHRICTHSVNPLSVE